MPGATLSPVPAIAGPAFSIRETQAGLSKSRKFADKLSQKIIADIRERLTGQAGVVTGAYGKVAAPILSTLSAASSLDESLRQNISNEIVTGLALGQIAVDGFGGPPKIVHHIDVGGGGGGQQIKPPSGELQFYVWKAFDWNNNPLHCWCDTVPPQYGPPPYPGEAYRLPTAGPMLSPQCAGIVASIQGTPSCNPPAGGIGGNGNGGGNGKPPVKPPAGTPAPAGCPDMNWSFDPINNFWFPNPFPAPAGTPVDCCVCLLFDAMYHHVGVLPDPENNTSWLKSHGYHSVSEWDWYKPLDVTFERPPWAPASETNIRWVCVDDRGQNADWAYLPDFGLDPFFPQSPKKPPPDKLCTPKPGPLECCDFSELCKCIEKLSIPKKITTEDLPGYFAEDETSTFNGDLGTFLDTFGDTLETADDFKSYVLSAVTDTPDTSGDYYDEEAPY